MSTDPYASCPCGSGKKLKWCCQDIQADIDRAFDQHNAGQHEAALQTVGRVVASHPQSAEAHGRLAQLLLLNGKPDEAEHALDAAFKLNPTYPFGFLLRGLMRQQEGEVLGSLMLFRKASEAFAPDAHDQLAYLSQLIGDTEFRLNKPIAARAAIRRAVAFDPGNVELREEFDATFGKDGRLPESARKDYAFRSPADAGPEWGPALQRGATGKMTDALRVLQAWADKHPNDPASWYNLGLVRAWLGDNGSAVEALARSGDLDSDEDRAAETWAFVQVLRCGHGMEAEADAVEHRVTFQIHRIEPVVGLLQKWEQERRLIGLRTNPEQGMVTGLVLDEVPSIVLSGAAAPPARLAAYVLLAGPLFQLWHPNVESVEKVVADAVKALGPAIGSPHRDVGPIQFGDAVADALLFPTAETTQFDAEAKIRTNAQNYFEETWVNRPLKSLLGKSPTDAASDPLLRKRLRGVIQFLQDCAAAGPIRLYDFDRLRAKLGLGGLAPVAEQASVSAASPDGELEDAFRAAQRGGDEDAAARHAKELIDRPASGDLYPVYSFLVLRDQRAGDFDSALGYIDAGEKADCEANAGRRRNEYELLRGKLLAKKKDAAGAKDVFERLLERVPGDLDLAGTAAEAMLGLRDAASALHFAEHGLKQAREQGNRDQEGRFQELVGAAKR